MKNIVAISALGGLEDVVSQATAFSSDIKPEKQKQAGQAPQVAQDKNSKQIQNSNYRNPKMDPP